MRESHEKKHDYIVTEFYFFVDGEVMVTMKNYLKKIVSDFPETIQGSDNSSSRATSHDEGKCH